MIHVLHIRKAGGTALKAALSHCAPGKLVLHEHARRLQDCPDDTTVFFVVRPPDERFVSGFNSRLRRGRPTYDRPWSKGEALAFALFPTANALAEALGSRNPLRRWLAERAMSVIPHLRYPLSYWLGSPDELAARRGTIIGTTATLKEDLQRLCRAASISAAVALPTDAKAAHARPDGMDGRLTPRARQNLARWFANDLALYRTCLALRAQQLREESMAPVEIAADALRAG